jgi:hypothetical protein
MDIETRLKLERAALSGDSEEFVKHGLPTFAEFSKNPKKYLGHSEELFESADAGSHILRKSNVVKRHRYEILGYRVNTLEEVQKIVLENGIDPQALDMRPQLEPLGGGQCDILVRFTTKEQRDKRAGW